MSEHQLDKIDARNASVDEMLPSLTDRLQAIADEIARSYGKSAGNLMLNEVQRATVRELLPLIIGHEKDCMIVGPGRNCTCKRSELVRFAEGK